MLQYNPSISGSLSVTGSLIVTNGVIGTISGVDVQVFSSSISQVVTNIQITTGSQNSRLGSIESFTSSTSARLNSIETTSASVDTLNTAQNTRLTNLEEKTGSLATTGSNTFYGTQTITGSLYISSDLIVQGSSSLQNITASAVSIGTNIVNLNTANPAIRYAGLVIGDSGSIGSSGSFLYDSVQDEMIFVHRGANTTVTSSVVLMGPQTYDNIGSETYPTNNRVQKGTGNEHLVDSNISDDGTTIILNSNAEVTGSLKITGSINTGHGRFKEWYTTGTGLALEVGVSSNIGNILTFDRTLSRYYPLQLSGGDGTGGNASYIQITTSGVGIGSAAPSYTLDVSGSGRFTGGLISGGPFTVQAGTGLTKHYFTSAGSGDALIQLYDNTGTVKIQLYTNGNSYFNGGKVGIGTATPQASLHIAAQADTTALMIGAGNGYEIFITGSDSANIYHASPNQAIYLNTNGGALYLGTSAASTLLTISGSNVGIGVTNPTATLQITGPNAVGTFFNAQNDGAGGAVFSRINASSFPFNQYIFNNGNLGINTSSPETKLHVEGSTAIGTTGTETILLLGRAIGAGASFQQAASLKLGRYQNAGGSFESYTRLDFALRDNSAASNYNTNTTVMTLTNAGDVGIGTTAPIFPLHVYKAGSVATIAVGSSTGQNLQFRMEEAGAVKFAITYVPADSSTRFFSNGSDKLTIGSGGNTGIDRTNPLAKLSVYGGAFQLMGDYANHQTIIKNAATAGTLNGSLTITVPDMAGAAGSVGYGGFSCEVYVAGYNAMYCHAWFSGYTNNGVTPSETAILRSNGGWSVSQFGNGSQGLTFVIDYPSGLIHPTARIIINKGGHAYENEYPANSITTVWT
jgi:hypothetical protein